MIVRAINNDMLNTNIVRQPIQTCRYAQCAPGRGFAAAGDRTLTLGLERAVGFDDGRNRVFE